MSVIRGPGGWWYRSSTEEFLAPCARSGLAGLALSSQLAAWVGLPDRQAS
ncbi:hypothetical protein [Actinomadura parmotrematis]|uniref:Uncharacterized protein n=1 Tax=Actinomadura parmotrematis TaxID=2864039 RepID=A0ABS7G6I5_9ACTN|nr:hypothetical protein [Actinomadura parmotrematis]MBW8487238.1 hypothetical protein [Actinomadura parmotrematis]